MHEFFCHDFSTFQNVFLGIGSIYAPESRIEFPVNFYLFSFQAGHLVLYLLLKLC